MSRFSNAPSVAPRHAPAGIGSTPRRVVNYNGGIGFIPSDPHAELFNAAVSGLLANDYYEKGDARLERIVTLVPACKPEWLAGFVRWLRSDANIRSAAIVIAAEYAVAGFPDTRRVVASAMNRADEPAEMIGYWFSRHGRNLPASVKRGIADAVVRLYNERSLLRYDGNSKHFRFGDVIEIVHPKPASTEQSALFHFALDRRRHKAVASPVNLPTISKTLMLEQSEPSIEALVQGLANGAHFDWERAAGWLPGATASAAFWHAMIPNMGYFALLRNLNNFDRAGVDPGQVIDRLTNGGAVRNSRVLPFRFLTAYKNLESDNYKVALSTAAEISLENLPRYAGKTIIMVDCSGSMSSAVGEGRSRNPLSRSELAGFIAESFARACTESIIASYANTINVAGAPLRHVNVLKAANDARYHANGGTKTWTCAKQAYINGADRMIIITDEETSDVDDGSVTCPVITWNVAGFKHHQAEHGKRNRFFVAGYNDSVLQTLPSLIAAGSTGTWPWEAK